MCVPVSSVVHRANVSTRRPSSCTVTEATRPGDFVCSGRGFQAIARPQERICPTQRDALIECAYPDVKSCLDSCREAEFRQARDAAFDARAPSGRVCPSYDVPCDSVCWIAYRELGGFQSELGMDAPGEARSLDADSGNRLADLAAQVVNCAIARAEACRGSDAGEPSDASLDASLDGGRVLADANWTTVLWDCARELGL